MRIHAWWYRLFAATGIPGQPGGGPNGGGLPARSFELPFGIGHPRSESRSVRLHIDARGARDTNVWLDLAPAGDLPYVERIYKASRIDSAEKYLVRVERDIRGWVEHRGIGRTLLLSSSTPVDIGAADPVDLMDINHQSLERLERHGRSLVRLLKNRVDIALLMKPGQVLPLVLIVEVPDDAASGERFRVDVMQFSGHEATGGVSLDIRAG